MWFRRFVKENEGYFYPLMAFLFIGSLLLFLYTKDVLILAVNSRYNTYGDLFFKYFTHVGDGLFYLSVALLFLLFISKEKAIMLVLSYALSTIPVQLVKNFAFAENFRPRAYFWDDYHRLHFVEGVEILVSHSFPSGHSAAAFSLFLCLSHIFKNQTLSLLFFVLAFLVGYSRMYLGQHFFADVYAGSIIAAGMTSVAIYLVEEKWRLSLKPTLRKGLLAKS